MATNSVYHLSTILFNIKINEGGEKNVVNFTAYRFFFSKGSLKHFGNRQYFKLRGSDRL